MKNKYVKFVIILNGTLLPILLLFALFQISKDIYRSNRKAIPEGVIVGEELEEAKNAEVALQGLKYHNFIELYNSENMYLPISLLTYEEERVINKFASTANDVGDVLLKYVNVVFVDENYKVIRSLLDKKGSIYNIEPQRKSNGYNNKKLDTTVRCIAYLIAFEDSNKDGKLNSADAHDLFISDMSGGDLTKVTNDINIDDFDFINSNSEILIHYTDRSELREEHKRKKIAIYNIKKRKLIDLSSLDKELDKLEKIIIE